MAGLLWTVERQNVGESPPPSTQPLLKDCTATPRQRGAGGWPQRWYQQCMEKAAWRTSVDSVLRHIQVLAWSRNSLEHHQKSTLGPCCRTDKDTTRHGSQGPPRARAILNCFAVTQMTPLRRSVHLSTVLFNHFASYRSICTVPFPRVFLPSVKSGTVTMADGNAPLSPTDPFTLSAFILQQQHLKAPGARGSLTMLLNSICVGCKFLSTAVRRVSLHSCLIAIAPRTDEPPRSRNA
jgi:hypothetical protein